MGKGKNSVSHIDTVTAHAFIILVYMNMLHVRMLDS